MCERPAETVKMAVVAGLYTVQKNALYVAVSNLDAAVFQLTSVFKLPPHTRAHACAQSDAHTRALLSPSDCWVMSR